MFNIISRQLLFTATLVLVSTCANAGLLGTTVTHCANTVYFGAVTTDVAQCDLASAQPTPATAIIGSGIEFKIRGNRLFDFSDTALAIQYVQPVASPSPDLIIFTLENTVTGVTLAGSNPIDVTWAF